MHGLTLVTVSKGYSSLQCVGFLLQWVFLLVELRLLTYGLQQLWCPVLVALWHVAYFQTKDRTHVPCTGDTIPPGMSLITYTSKNIVFICPWILSLKVPIWGSNYSYPVLAGRILNHFSKVIGHMDDLLPIIFQDFIQVMHQSCQSSHRE